MWSVVTRILGINFKTTAAGLASLMAIGAAIIAAWRTKDFATIFDNLPEFFVALGVVITALGLLKAKDQNVTGAGTVAKVVDSDGKVYNREGEQVTRQPAVVPPVVDR